MDELKTSTLRLGQIIEYTDTEMSNIGYPSDIRYHGRVIGVTDCGVYVALYRRDGEILPRFILNENICRIAEESEAQALMVLEAFYCTQES